MKSSYYQYRQKELAEQIYLNGFQSTHYQYELRLVALLLKKNMGLKSEQVFKHLENLCLAYIQDYDQMKHRYRLLIRRAVNYAESHNTSLLDCQSISIYASEFEYIQSLSDLGEEVQRTVLTMFVQKKLDSYSYYVQHGEPYILFGYTIGNKRWNALPRVAGIKKKAGFDFIQDVVSKMNKAVLTEVVDGKHPQLKLNMADKIMVRNPKGEDVAFEVRDYEHIGLYFDKYFLGKEVGFCKICGQGFRLQKGHRHREYCTDHERGVKTGQNVFATCSNCGQVFMKNAHASRQILCSNCRLDLVL